MSWRKVFVVAIVMAAPGVVVGCTQSEGTTSITPTDASSTSEANDEPVPPSSAPRPTLTDPALQPPKQQNKYTTSGRPQVVVDPCTWFHDDAVIRAGLDPSTRRRGQDWIAEYTFLTCDFDGEYRRLQVNSGNVTWEENLQKNGASSEPLTVNGREAIWYRDPDLEGTCAIHLRTKVGFVMLSAVRTHKGVQAGLKRCDGVLEIAEAFEPEIGEGN